MKQTTSDIQGKSLFKAHGQADYEVNGRVVSVRAEGPFNAELVPAISQTVAKLLGPLMQSGNWAQIITFHNSAMCSQQALHDFAASLKARYTNPATNPVVALVMGPDVEGAGIMPAMICECYAQAGVTCRAFASQPEALQWAQSLLK